MKRWNIIFYLIGCLLLLILVASSHFLWLVSQKEELWQDYLKRGHYEKILKEADQLYSRYDYRVFSSLNLIFIGEELSRLHQIDGQAATGAREFTRALQIYQRAGSVKNPILLSQFAHNAGRILIKGGRLGLALDAYKKALRYDSHNLKAAYNLEALVAYLQSLQDTEGKKDKKEQSGLESFDIDELDPWRRDKEKAGKEEERDVRY